MLTRWLHNLSETAVLLLVLIPLCIVRALSTPHTLGYDYGFYRYAALHPTVTPDALLTGIHGGYANILLAILHALHVPVDIGLTAYLYLAALLLGVALFYCLRPHSRVAAVFGCLLLACSIIQSEAYNMFLWKTVLALPLLLVGLLALQKEKYGLLGGVVFALLFTHRTTLIVLLLVIGLYAIIRAITANRRGLLLCGVLGLGLLTHIFYNSLKTFWQTAFGSVNADVLVGIFFHNKNIFAALLPITLLTLYGCVKLIKYKGVPTTSLLLASVSLGWILIRLPFFHRFYIYLDLGLLLLGAVSLATIWQNHKGFWLRTAVLAGLSVLFLQNIQHVQNTPPLISQNEIQEISSFATPQPAPFVLATSAEDAPWLLGYLQGSRLAAPGLFEDTHSETAWQQFWLGIAQQQFLSSFPQPLYLYDRSFKLPGRINDCLRRVSENFSKFTCN